MWNVVIIQWANISGKKKLRSNENKLNYIPVLDGHPSLGPTTCPFLFCFVFFTYRSHCSQKNAFQNKRCCWSSLSWDSLLKNSSLLLPSFGQYQTNINNCGADVLTKEDSKAGLRHIPNQNKTPTTEINLLVWVLWDKSTFWISSHIFIKQSREFLFVCVF